MQELASQTPLSFAWRWFRWAALCATVAALAPRASHLLEVNTLAIWILLVVLSGGIFFMLGYLYGRFKLRAQVRR